MGGLVNAFLGFGNEVKTEKEDEKIRKKRPRKRRVLLSSLSADTPVDSTAKKKTLLGD